LATTLPDDTAKANSVRQTVKMTRNIRQLAAFSRIEQTGGYEMKYVLAVAAVVALATPAFADEVGVHVGPVGAGVTTGESHVDRDRDRDRTTVIKEREPADRTTVIKKEHDEPREKTIIKERD